MGRCCQSNSWATAVLDGLPTTGTVASIVDGEGCGCQSLDWAKEVLDQPAACNRLTNGITSSLLAAGVGLEYVIAKEDVSPVDCGYLGVGSLIFSSGASGASATITEVCDVNYVAVIVSQPSSSLPVQGSKAVAVGESFSLINADTTKYNMHAPTLLAPESATVGYAVTNVEIMSTGFKVWYNAAVAEVGHILSYMLIRKA